MKTTILTAKERQSLVRLIERTTSYAYAWRRYCAYLEDEDFDVNEYIAPIPFKAVSMPLDGDITDINVNVQEWALKAISRAKASLAMDDFNTQSKTFYAEFCITGKDKDDCEGVYGNESQNECFSWPIKITRIDGEVMYATYGAGIHGTVNDPMMFHFMITVDEYDHADLTNFTDTFVEAFDEFRGPVHTALDVQKEYLAKLEEFRKMNTDDYDDNANLLEAVREFRKSIANDLDKWAEQANKG